MNKPNIQTAKQVVPMIYGYSTPEVERHIGWTKIGYTEQDVETRINQQTHTADIKWSFPTDILTIIITPEKSYSKAKPKG